MDDFDHTRLHRPTAAVVVTVGRDAVIKNDVLVIAVLRGTRPREAEHQCKNPRQTRHHAKLQSRNSIFRMLPVPDFHNLHIFGESPALKPDAEVTEKGQRCATTFQVC